MLTFLYSLFARLPVAECFQRIAGWSILAVLVIALLGVGKCSYDRAVVDGYLKDANREAEAEARKADNKAADTRLEDDRQARELEEDYAAAIRHAEDLGAPAPAAVALACERLRKAGRDTGSIPACR